jgi:uncharacterized membrane protein YjgN (DUF898 family)
LPEMGFGRSGHEIGRVSSCVNTYRCKKLIVIIVVMVMTVMVIGRSQGIIVGSLSISHYSDSSDRDDDESGTHKESNAHVLVIKYILSMSLKLIVSTSHPANVETYLDQLDDLGKRIRISLQLLPNSPILSSLSLDIVKLIHNFLSCGPGPTR